MLVLKMSVLQKQSFLCIINMIIFLKLYSKKLICSKQHYLCRTNSKRFWPDETCGMQLFK